MATEKGDMTMDGTLERPFREFWGERSEIADFKADRSPSGNKASHKFLVMSEKLQSALGAKDKSLFDEFEDARMDFMSEVSLENYRLGFQDALRLIAGA